MRSVLLALALVLSGCFQVSSVLSVRADGSATLTDEVTMSGFGLMALQDMEDDLTEEAFASRADSLGPGVTVASVEARDDGFTIVYEVPDVRALRYTIASLPSEGGPSSDELPVTFGFESGPTATLDIRIAKPDAKAAPDGASAPDVLIDSTQQIRAFEMARSMMGDARISMAVEVEGEIVETNAAHADGARVWLVDLPMDALFGAIAERPEFVFADAPPSMNAAAEMLEDVEGVAVQGPGTVRVRFR